MFTIEGIKVGWFVFKFSESEYSFTSSDYLDYDFPKELLEALYYLLHYGKGEQYLCVQDEPPAYIMKLTLSGEKIKIVTNEAENDSFGLMLCSLDKEPLGDVLFEAEYNATDFVKNVLSEMQRCVEKLGVSGYEKNWFPYPVDLLRNIRRKI